jgi:hypothetical protein
MDISTSSQLKEDILHLQENYSKTDLTFFYRYIQPPIQWVPGTLSPRIKRPGREADHSPTSRAEVKNAWSYSCTPLYVFMAWCLVKR